MNLPTRRLASSALALVVTLGATLSVVGCNSEPEVPTNPVTEDAQKEAEVIIQKEYGPTQSKKR